MGNVVVPLLIVSAGGALVWSGITDPAGGTFAGLSRLLRGEAPVKRAPNPAASAGLTAALVAANTGGGTTTAAPAAPVAYSPGTKATGTRARVIAESAKWLGVPYLWAGESKRGVDCSGLTMRVFATVGIKLPHYSGAQATMGRAVTAKTAQPGDLVFFGTPVHHVGIYLGNGRIRHAPRKGTVVHDAAIWHTERVQYRSLINDAAKAVSV